MNHDAGKSRGTEKDGVSSLEFTTLDVPDAAAADATSATCLGCSKQVRLTGNVYNDFFNVRNE